MVVTVNYGNFENGSVFFKDTLTDNATYAVGFDKYSATATYIKGDKKITAVDGARVYENTSTNCGYTCYDTFDGTLDLRLK